MKDKELTEILKKGAHELGVGLTEAQVTAFVAYLRELKVWNTKINLTSIDTDREIISRHFVDSLIPLKYLGGCTKLLDIGAGGGFPGLPLKIAYPALEVTLVDKVEKKVFFMRHAIRTLGVKGAEAVAGRVEDPAFIKKYGGKFDCVISRAFTELKGFIEVALPFARPGGSILAMKGPAYIEELKAVEGMEGIEGLHIEEIKAPLEDRTTVLVIYRKKGE